MSPEEKAAKLLLTKVASTYGCEPVAPEAALSKNMRLALEADIAQALRKERKAALEEAARLVERLAGFDASEGDDDDHQELFAMVARRIRAMAEEPSNGD